MAVGAAAAGVGAALRRCEDESTGLDGAGAQQHMPMRLAGRHGESGGNADYLSARLRQIAGELRKAEIGADRHAESAPRRRREDGLRTGTDPFGFAINLAVRQIDVEEVD